MRSAQGRAVCIEAQHFSGMGSAQPVRTIDHIHVEIKNECPPG